MVRNSGVLYEHRNLFWEAHYSNQKLMTPSPMDSRRRSRDDSDMLGDYGRGSRSVASQDWMMPKTLRKLHIDTQREEQLSPTPVATDESWKVIEESCARMDAQNMRILEVDLTCIGDSRVMYEFTFSPSSHNKSSCERSPHSVRKSSISGSSSLSCDWETDRTRRSSRSSSRSGVLSVSRRASQSSNGGGNSGQFSTPTLTPTACSEDPWSIWSGCEISSSEECASEAPMLSGDGDAGSQVPSPCTDNCHQGGERQEEEGEANEYGTVDSAPDNSSRQKGNGRVLSMLKWLHKRWAGSLTAAHNSDASKSAGKHRMTIHQGQEKPVASLGTPRLSRCQTLRY
eukprot:TRINITY_DN2436_c0_g1_i1.p1 TRINITY_DN2436_c0_g1~~TRINITY_DN2436_c0_g1_i1.p1  ORF type:complete len:342 (+),score=25.46 TRINITY_DN2436_c0_g1_i1:163-1188(+)